MYRRVLSIVLAALMLISLLPMSVLAEGDEPETEYTEPVTAAEPEETEEPIETPEPVEIPEEPEAVLDPAEINGAGVALDEEHEPVKVDEEHFPDILPFAKKCDSNGDGYLSTGEIAVVTEFTNQLTPGIQDFSNGLKGVEYFTELQTVHLYLQDLSSADLSKNAKLKNLTLQWYLTNPNSNPDAFDIDLSNNTELEYVRIESAGKVKFGNNTKLETLVLKTVRKPANPLTDLDISGCTGLKTITLDCPKMSSLVLPMAKELTSLTIGDCKLKKLDLRGCTALSDISIKNLGITQLLADDTAITTERLPEQTASVEALSGIMDMKALVGEENFVRIHNVVHDGYDAETGIVTVGNQALLTYDFYAKPDGSVILPVSLVLNKDLLPVSEENFPDKAFREAIAKKYDTDSDGYLSTMELYSAKDFKISGTENIESFAGLEKFIYTTSVSISSCGCSKFIPAEMPNLESISVTYCDNSFEYIDLSALTNLQYVRIHETGVNTLILGDLEKLETLYCTANKYLTSLDVSGCKNLKSITCFDNKLAVLDLSMFTPGSLSLNTKQQIQIDTDAPYVDFGPIASKYNDRFSDFDGCVLNTATGLLHFTGNTKKVSFKFDVYGDGSELMEVNVIPTLIFPARTSGVYWGMSGTILVLDEKTGEYSQVSVTLPGYINWRMNGGCSGLFRVEYINRSGAGYYAREIYIEPSEAGVYYDAGFLLGDLPSGSYIACVTPLGDGVKYSDGARDQAMGVFEYTRPDTAVAAPSNARWGANGKMLFNIPNDLSLAAGYQIRLYYSETAAGKMDLIYTSDIVYGNDLADGITHDLGSIFEYNDLPTGYYTFDVRTISGIVTLATNSAWTGQSTRFYNDNPGYGTYETLVLLQGENDPDVIRGTVQALDKATLAALMLLDVYDEDTILLLAELEEKLGGLADVIVKDDLDVFGGNEPLVIGAALNTPIDQSKNISVIFSRSSKNYAVSEDLDPAKTVVMNISLGNTRSSTVSDVPMKLLIPMPQGIDYRYAAVYDCRKGKAGEFLGYIMYDDQGNSYISTVMLELGDIMIGELVHDTCPQSKFTDAVPESHWAHESIDYVLNRGIMSGTSDTTFEPDGTVTRAMIAVMLYNLSGEPAIHSANPFTDVPDTWYTVPIIWAYENGIVSGNGDGTFNPNGKITREQLAVMMANYAEYCGKSISAEFDLSKFADKDAVSSWAVPCIKWACANGIINGSEDGGKLYLMPQGNATRAQIAVIFQNFCETFGV